MGQKCSFEAGNKAHISLAVTNSSGRNAAHLSNSNYLQKSELRNSCSQQIVETFRECSKNKPGVRTFSSICRQSFARNNNGKSIHKPGSSRMPLARRTKSKYITFPLFHPFRCFILVFPILSSSTKLGAHLQPVNAPVCLVDPGVE